MGQRAKILLRRVEAWHQSAPSGYVTTRKTQRAALSAPLGETVALRSEPGTGSKKKEKKTKTKKVVSEEKTDTHTVEQRSRVEDEGDHEGSRPQNFAPLWELQLQEPAEGHKGWQSVTLHEI